MGLPYYKEKGVYGDLYIELNVVKYDLSEEQKESIWKIITNKTMKDDINNDIKKAQLNISIYFFHFFIVL